MPSSEGGAAALATPVRYGLFHAGLVTARPKQWIKNTLVVAAAGAAGALGRDDVPLRVGVAFAAFCLLASGIYAINDVRDVEEDRQHPRKRHRPVAAGQLEPGIAMVMGVGLILTGLGLCAAVRPLLAAVGVGYVMLTISYSTIWRYVPVLDIVAIAGGFVLRAIAGGVAADVALSRWFVVVVSCAALFIAAGKRQAELRRTERKRIPGRRVLALYTQPRLRLILAGCEACALFAYCVWAFQLPSVDGIPWRLLTIMPFAAGMVRYGTLLHTGDGEAPEDLILGDRWLQLAAVTWLVLFAVGAHAAA